jgi:hypothetical protein
VPSPVSSLIEIPASSATGVAGKHARDLSVESLFRVDNVAYASFKTRTHKVHYPFRPRTGVTALVTRRNHPGSCAARLWHRFRSLCATGTSPQHSFGAEKIHINVAPYHLEKALECLNDLLVSNACPFERFSVVNPDMFGVDPGLDESPTITLHVHDQINRNHARSFLMALGTHLEGAQVERGKVPPHDSPITGSDCLSYFSYRDEDLPWRDPEPPPAQETTDVYKSLCDLKLV